MDENLDNGLLAEPAVWTSIDLYLADSEWPLSDVARHLEFHTSAVSRHIKTWTQIEQNIASERSTAAPASRPADRDRPRSRPKHRRRGDRRRLSRPVSPRPDGRRS